MKLESMEDGEQSKAGSILPWESDSQSSKGVRNRAMTILHI